MTDLSYDDGNIIKGGVFDKLRGGLYDDGDGRVLNIYKQLDGSFVFQEACDNYFTVKLTTYEVREFANRLLDELK